MSDKEIKESINPEDIEAKDTDRRKFIVGSAGTLVATAVAATALSGCSACDSDYGNIGATWDSDPAGSGGDLLQTYDSDTGDSC